MSEDRKVTDSDLENVSGGNIKPGVKGVDPGPTLPGGEVTTDPPSGSSGQGPEDEGTGGPLDTPEV